MKLCAVLIVITFTAYAQDMVTIENGKFIRNGEPYYYLGTNFWYGMHLGALDTARLTRELDRLQHLGITNLRVMASSEGADTDPWRVQPSLQTAPGEYNEDLLRGLDYLLYEMSKRDMLAVMCLNNFWPWSGGMAQYVNWATHEPIPYPPPAENGSWGKYQRYSARFYSNKEALRFYQDHVKKMVNRTNSLTGIVYKDDPTIMSWQLANEPEGANNVKAYRKWIKLAARFIRSEDKNHLISIGSEGNTASSWAGTNFRKDHQVKWVDYCTMHIWVQNWGWYDPQGGAKALEKARNKAEKYLLDHLEIANKLKKPMVLEEFGMSRDKDDHSPSSGVSHRDDYYTFLFETAKRLVLSGNNMSGVNFWAWGGEGRPRVPKAIWKQGDDLIGDPPHEYQGWYSVYDTDSSTLEIIKRYANEMNDIK
ncbi:hypothetical protein FNH22_07860 [Fulvivirga sp. M361]|uniref:glycoside hydrolase 5 family protein n=1 Tax=Fulvivirga sp. M361 TaxID=2594266 RepID=UPI00117A1933|nr:hypothetical protein [Fulvivirga sp. M361]TRX59960.1 hypothetical protein FNH22_07860 [Fulvivirga sp. M361]